jgi:hypothetical protein
MKSGTILVLLLGVYGSALPGAAFAEGAVGGPKKSIAVGGPAKANVIGGPVKQNALGGPPKPNVALPVKQTPAVLHAHYVRSASVTPPLLHPGCHKVPCVTKRK